MTKLWTQDAIQQYIDDFTQESLTLEYKAADALSRSAGKIKEITKDISAMANSSGGTIIYGIREFDAPDRKHLPERLDPIDQAQFSKEWLEQVANNIRPHIDGLLIYPVPLNTAHDSVAYVVEIPQSTTAHQATDWRYYKRFNFMAVPMEDYEVRDTMGRQQYPKVDLDFEIQLSTERFSSHIDNKPHTATKCILKVTGRNTGRLYAQYVNCFILVPLPLLHQLTLDQIKYRQEATVHRGSQEYFEYYEDNTIRDVVDFEHNLYATVPKYGPSRYDPILPGLAHTWEIMLREDLDKVQLQGMSVKWSTYADNAPLREGSVTVADIRVIDRRSQKEVDAGAG